MSGPTATVRDMTTRHSLIALAAVVLAACGGEPETPPAEATLSPAQVLPNIAMPPGGEALGSEGGAEAATLLISTPMVADSVAKGDYSPLARALAGALYDALAGLLKYL